MTTRTFDLTDPQPDPAEIEEVPPIAQPPRALAGPEPGASLSSESAYDGLRARVSSRTAPRPVELRVPSIDGCTVVYAIDFEWETLQAWRRGARDPETGIPDPMKVALAVMSNTCREIRFRGQSVRLHGEPRTFVHEDIQQMLDATGTADAVRKLYANDAHVVITGERIVAAAGYGDVVEVASDPTTASSGR